MKIAIRVFAFGLLFALSSMPFQAQAGETATPIMNRILYGISACLPGARQFTVTQISVAGNILTAIVNIGDSPDILVYLSMDKRKEFHCLSSMGGGVWNHAAWVRVAQEMGDRGIRISPEALHRQLLSKHIYRLPVNILVVRAHGRFQIINNPKRGLIIHA